MSTLKSVYIRAEITFWLMTIQLLRESRLLQGLLRRGHALLTTHRWIAEVPTPVLWVAAGLSCGFLLGFVSGLIGS